jgi:streptogramin lyase
MFTDIVGSTELATKLGDREWRRLLSRHHDLVRRMLKQYGGREIDTAGDGFFATFDQPARAIRCANDLVHGLHRMGIEIRAGIHMGEVEVLGPKVSGIAVHIGSRVMSKAGPGEVLVSSVVRDLMAGSEIKFEDRGLQELKGIPAQWHLFAVDSPTVIVAGPEAAEEAAAPARPRMSTGRLALIVGAVVLVLVVVPVVVTLRGGGGASTKFEVGPNTVARIDPASGKVVGGAKVGNRPTKPAFGDGTIWVLNFDDRTVQRIDPKTNQASSGFGGLNGNPTGMAVGGGFAWVTSSFVGTLSKIDPATNIAQPIQLETGVKGVAYGEGSVWVTNNVKGTVLRIDPTSASVSKVIELPAGSAPSGIAVGGGSVWVADSVGSKVYRIDPSSNAVVGTGTPVLRGHPVEVAFGKGFVWVTNESDDSVTRIDPKSGEGVTVEHVGNGPSGIAAGDEGVWVANKLDGTVVQIDPQGAKVLRVVRIGFQPESVTVGGGAVWVTVDPA